MQVILTGSRTYADRERVWEVLDTLYGLALRSGERFTLIHGKAPNGADRHAARWVEWTERWENKIDEKPYPARWGVFHRAAGIRRNEQMWAENWHTTDLCLSFRWPGESRGTDHCTALAVRHECPVWQVGAPPDPIPPMPYFRLNLPPLAMQ